MDILIQSVIIVVILVWSVKKFKPELWVKITSILKK